MARFCANDIDCIRHQILKYFGEDFGSKFCESNPEVCIEAYIQSNGLSVDINSILSINENSYILIQMIR